MILRINFTPEKVSPALKDAAASILLEGRSVGDIIVKGLDGMIRIEISNEQALEDVKELMEEIISWSSEFKGFPFIPAIFYAKDQKSVLLLDQRAFEIEAC